MKRTYLIFIFVFAIAVLYIINGQGGATFKLFYYNELEDRELNNGEIACDTRAVMPVIRDEKKDMSIEHVIKTLIEGTLTPEEKIAGFDTEFPNQNFTLLNTELKNDVLRLTFNEVPGFTSGGSCRVGLLRAQIEKTALQFENVKEVIILPEEILQP